MKIKVYDNAGGTGTYDGDDFAVDEVGQLRITRADETVAMYASGKWIAVEKVSPQ